MHTFKDSAGRTWLASLTVGSVKKARDLAGVDLASALTGGGEVFKALAEDPVKLCTALYAISRPETGDAPPLDAFLEAVDGDCLETATDALVAEVVDFFPKPIRGRMGAALAAAKRRQEEALAALDAASTPSASPGSSLASPDLTPAS